VNEIKISNSDKISGSVKIPAVKKHQVKIPSEKNPHFM